MLKLRIVDILKAQEMNVQQFSKAAGITYKTALDLQKGNARRVDLETLDKVCGALNVTPGELFAYTPNKKSK